MSPLDDLFLQNILRIDNSGKVLQKEDDKIEYKELFENGSKEAKAKYAKEMAALYNYEGGYLIFGVNDDNELVGLDNFNEPDNVQLVNDINTYFSPAIRFQSKLFSTNGKYFFCVHVEKRKSIPTVCIKSHQDILKDATIYWRYSAQSAPITSGDLIHLLNSLKGEASQELTEITKKDFRSKFKPKLHSNASTSGNEFGIRIENEGEDAIMDKFFIIDSNIDKDKISVYQWNQPVSIRKNSSIRITGNSPSNASALEFKMKLQYRDTEGHKYESIINWTRGRSKMDEPIFVEG